MSDKAEVRKALIVGTFRQANEQIRAAVEEHDPPFEHLPFICECAEQSCTQIIRMRLAEYRAVREHPRRFVVVVGHEANDGPVIVVEKASGYVVVEKTGRAGEIVERLAEEGS